MTKQIKVSELSGAQLDLWVASALDLSPIPNQPRGFFYWDDGSGWFNPTANWALAGPIIDLHKIALDPMTRNREPGAWQAQIWQPYDCQRGATALEAAMRVFVGSVYGPTVFDDPA